MRLQLVEKDKQMAQFHSVILGMRKEHQKNLDELTRQLNEMMDKNTALCGQLEEKDAQILSQHRKYAGLKSKYSQVAKRLSEGPRLYNPSERARSRIHDLTNDNASLKDQLEVLTKRLERYRETWGNLPTGRPFKRLRRVIYVDDDEEETEEDKPKEPSPIKKPITAQEWLDAMKDTPTPKP